MEKQLKMTESEELARAWSPKGEPRLHGRDEVQCSQAALGMSQREDDDHHGKRSVVARVKDKARRLKNSLRWKKHDRNEDNASPVRQASLVEEEEEEEEEEDPEFHGAPMYESMTAPQLLTGPKTRLIVRTLSPETLSSSTASSPTTPKEPLAVEQPGLKAPNACKNHPTEFPVEPSELPAAPPEADPSDGRTLAQNVKEILTPAYNMITSASQVIASKIHGQPESMDELGAKQACDKDVSVKKYLMEKLQPGEDDRVLSQVITEAIAAGPSGDGATGGGAEQVVVGAVEKFKGAVSSLVGMANISDDGSPGREAVSGTAMVSPAKLQVDHSGQEISRKSFS